MQPLEIATPYLLFLGDAPDDLAVKTARGVLDWRRDLCLGQTRLDGARVTLGLPDMTPEEAAAQGARTLVLGVVNPGGVMPESWVPSLVAGIEAGLDIASGLHMRLAEVPELADAAERHGRRLIDVRHAGRRLPTGKGVKRAGKRILTVGSDCSVGKKYTALCLHRDMTARGLDADFRATGQTGILIAGGGIAVDAVPADFISGAAEVLTPEADPAHWDVVEGQGSLFHPSFAGVSLGLLHGAQPDALVICHEPTRTHMRNVATPIPDLGDVIALNLTCARLTNPAVRAVGIAVNTAALDAAEAADVKAALAEAHGLPAVDPVKDGTGAILDAMAEGGLF